MLLLKAYSQIDYVRYKDNFNYLKADSIVRKGTEKLKYISLNTVTNISFGGELREQIQYYNNYNFGDPPSAPDQSHTLQLLHRVMAHANIEFGSKTRVFTQLNSTFRFLNQNRATPEIDENHLSLHQLFGEYRLHNQLVLRLGRQEISYGSHRLITYREGPNTRLAFDAAIVKYSAEKRKIDLLAISPVVSRKGVFDDGTLKDLLAGVYATEKVFCKRMNIDYYILHFQSHRRKYNYQEGVDSRRITGLRVYSQNKSFNYEAEATYQFGTFNDLKVSAYSLSADVNTAIPTKVEILFGIAGNYVSGDRDINDKQLNTYNSLFSKPQYGLTAPIGATNIITFNPYLRSAPVKRFNLLLGAYFLWRQSNKDGLYSPDGTELKPKPERLMSVTDKQIGTLLVFESNYAINKHLSIAVDASRFFAGGFLKQTGKGNDITYLSFKAGYKF